MILSGLLLLAFVAHAVSPPLAFALPAFPGAEGFGADTPGGRGGKVYEVTNLKNAGPRSFRAAVEASGPRIVVFRVGGIIDVEHPFIQISNPYITIVGQTAPGDGITLRNAASNGYSPLAIITHDVVIRHLRIRPGATPADQGGSDCINAGLGGRIQKPASNVVLDHLSLSWATDEQVDISTGSQNVTLQWCILSEGLNSRNPRGSTNYGMLIGGRNTGNISVHHNLFAHTQYRNPQHTSDGIVDVVNNVMYNYFSGGLILANGFGWPVIGNAVGNYAKTGPKTQYPKNGILLKHVAGQPPMSIYVRDNVGPGRPNGTGPQSASVKCDSGETHHGPWRGCDPSTYIVEKPFPAPAVTVHSAPDALKRVLEGAGATLPRRDSVDARVVADVRNGTGDYISDPSEVGGWPAFSSGTALPDTDHDGMPDRWEVQYRLNPNDPSDGAADRDGDGYTNVEEYLNGTDPTTPSPRSAAQRLNDALRKRGP